MKKYQNKTLSVGMTILLAVTLLGVFGLIFDRSGNALVYIPVFTILMGLFIIVLWIKMNNILIDDSGISFVPLLQQYLPFLKSKKIRDDQVQAYAFDVYGPIHGKILDTPKIMVLHNNKIYRAVFDSPLQDMSNFRKDVIDCLGTEKLVAALPLTWKRWMSIQQFRDTKQ